MKVLQKQKDKKFTVLHLTDTHLYHDEWIGEKGEHLKKTVNYLVEQSKPDLITISGDLAWAGQYDSYEDFANWIDSYGIPWAPVFGNHDDQDGYEAVAKAAKILEAKSTCLLEQGDPALGYGNYVIGIEEEGKPVHGIIMMDSHANKLWVDAEGKEHNPYAELYPEQFPWYRQQVEELKAQGVRETSLIMHIPIYTYHDAIKAALKADVDPKEIPFYNGEQDGCWNPGYEDSFGVYREGICSYPVDNGFFEEILAGGTTKTVICGHDHVNTFAVPYKGVRLAYGLKTGRGSYHDDRINGGTILTIDSDGKLEMEHCFYLTEE
ncbi:MAG: hypothetical protein E7610_00055 [Ruminococcaceae bacterium]|nr:hypothetical protein [Oscillospiraceae bacterium]